MCVDFYEIVGLFVALFFVNITAFSFIIHFVVDFMKLKEKGEFKIGQISLKKYKVDFNFNILMTTTETNLKKRNK